MRSIGSLHNSNTFRVNGVEALTVTWESFDNLEENFTTKQQCYNELYKRLTKRDSLGRRLAAVATTLTSSSTAEWVPYVCGEETSRTESLEGKPGKPRLNPLVELPVNYA